MRYTSVIFDLDGVLAFTDEYHYTAWKQLADKLGIAFDEQTNNQLRGVSRMECLEILLGDESAKFSDSEKQALAAEKNETYVRLLENLSPQSISEETIEALDTLRAMGLKLAIGSSSKNAEYILERTGIAHYFTAVASGNNITRTKPDPEVFLLAAKLLGAQLQDCLVVEDAHAGIEAAHRGGFDSAGMGDAYSSGLATYRIERIGEIIGIVWRQAMKIGIGTYSFGGIASYLGLGLSLREKLETAKSLGFDCVELLPVDLDNNPEDIKRWLRETGLEAVSVHSEPTEEIVKALAAIGGKAVIWAGTPFCNKAEAIEVAQQMDNMAEMAAPYGIKVGYHNHSHEFYFTEGKTLLEHLLDNGSKFYLQLDCGWAMNAGTHPPSIIRKYSGRIISVHVKENSKVSGPGSLPKSRYSNEPNPGDAFVNVMKKSREEREAMLVQFNEWMKNNHGDMSNQCKMGAPESNIDWREVKSALDEQAPPVFWIVERESLYDERDKCLAEDCGWLRKNLEGG